MLTETEIKRNMREATSERLLTASANGRGAGVLRLRIRPGARGVSAVWIASWKQGGQRGTKQLGRYPEMTLAAARRKYEDEVAPLVAAGKRPRVAVVAEGRPTVERMFQGYVASMRAAGKASAGEVERALLTGKDNAAAALGRNRLAGDIDAEDVVSYVAGFYRRDARAAADKARSYIASAYSWAIKAEHDYTAAERMAWGVKANPAATVRRDPGAIAQRDRNLTAEEIRHVWHNAPGPTGDLLRLVIACGQRVLETARVEGAEIDLAARVWTMPAHKTKGGKRSHVVPLPSQAVEIFRRLIDQHGAGPLFPGARGGMITVSSISKATSRLKGITPFQPRDLRRTWKSRAGEAGVDRFTRDLIQQHAQGDTGSKFYDRMDYLPKMREAMEKWAAWLGAALG